MVFNTIVLLLFAAAIPLWICRQYLIAKLEPRARAIFKRLAARQESAIGFAFRTFLVLLAFAASVVGLVYGLSFIKEGRIIGSSYRDIIRNRLYSGIDSVDPHIDTYLYEQSLPLVIILTCLLLAISLTLVLKAIHDISVLSRLKRRLKNLIEKSS